MKKLFTLLVAAFTALIVNATAETWSYPTSTPANPFGGGTGTEAYPYLIKNAQQLANLAYMVNQGNSYEGCYFKMTRDIILNENVIDENGNLNSGTFQQWTPIGGNFTYIDDNSQDSKNPFSGTFDAKGHSVCGLYFSDLNYQQVGLFGAATKARFFNVGLKDSYIYAHRDCGGLVGQSLGSSYVRCFNSSTIKTSSFRVGGIVGGSGRTSSELSDSLLACYNSGKISSESGNSASGICGGSFNETYFEYCYNTGSVYSGGTYAGGITISSGTDIIIRNCFNTGDISANRYDGYVGPIFGNPSSSCTIDNTYYLNDCCTSGNSYGTSEPASAFSDGTVLSLIDPEGTYFKQGANGYPVLIGVGEGTTFPMSYRLTYPDWTSTNAGQGGVTSSKTYTFEAEDGDSLSFDWTISSEENCDKYYVSVDGSQVVSTSGVNSGKYEAVLTEGGTHKVIAKYMKDADGDAGDDLATVSNLTVASSISSRDTETYDDWTSTNYHEASSTSSNTYTIKAGKGDVISFDYATSCEEDCDIMSVLIDGATIMEASGKAVTGSNSYTFKAKGTHTMKVQYTKDDSKNIGDDQVTISNIVLTYAEPKTALKELALNDDLKGFTALKDFEVEALSYERTFNSANTWQALYLPFDLDYSTLAEDYDVAELNDVHQWDSDEDGVMDITKLEVLKVKSGTLSAYTPYVIRAKEAGDKTFSLADANIYENNDSTFEVMNMKSIFSFKGSCQTVSGTDMYNNKYYALNSGALCQAASTSASLKPFRWYMSVTDRQGNPVSLARVYLTIYGEEDEETETGILELDNSTEPDAPVYDLSGRRVTDLRQGSVYIKNGRKFITK